MVEIDQYQFYSPEDRPRPTRWWQEKKIWTISGVILGLIISILLVVLLVTNTVKNNKLSNLEQRTLSRAQELMSDCTDGDQTCIDNALSKAAQVELNPKTCAELENQDDQINCAVLIAKQTNDIKACDPLASEAESRCRDQASLFIATTQNLATACDTISDPKLKANCAGVVYSATVLRGDCANNPSTACLDSQRLIEAENSGNPAACQALKTEYQEECNNVINTVDEDRDGLVTKEEFLAGTDPFNADSDGDGYNDGMEVKNGYDPLN